MSHYDSSDCSDSEYDEVPVEEHVETRCPFTDKSYRNAEEYYTYMKNNKNFDIWHLVQVDLKLDCYGYLKLVNFLRTQYKGQDPPSADSLKEQRSTWMQDSFMAPVLEDDPLLMFMVGQDEVEEEVCFDGLNCASYKYVCEVLKS